MSIHQGQTADAQEEAEPPPASAADLVKPGRWSQTFSSLAERDYAWYFTGNFAFFMAMQMNMILRGFLAYDLTDAASALGFVAITGAISMSIIAPIGGVVADWFNKRTMLLFTQCIAVVVNLVMTVLILTGAIEFWHLLASALLMGSMMALVMPARQALVAQVVPQHKLMNAISLQMGGMNLTRILGPGLAGFLIAPFDVGWAYAVTVILFALGVLCTFPLPKEGMIAKAQNAESPRNFADDLLGGMRFAIGSPLFRLLLLTALLMPLFAFPVQQILPVFAEEVFNWPDLGLGILAASAGAGGLLGTLVAANLDSVQRKGRIMFAGGLIMAVTFIGFAAVPNFWAATVLLGIGNMGAMLFMVTNNTVIQAKVPDEYRGRVMSLLMMSFGLMLVGILPLTIGADIFGVAAAVGGLAVVLLVVVIVVFALSGQLRNLRLAPLEEAEMSPAQAAKLVAEGKITREEADRLSGRAQTQGSE